MKVYTTVEIDVQVHRPATCPEKDGNQVRVKHNVVCIQVDNRPVYDEAF
jgi:hypothetical protein